MFGAFILVEQPSEKEKELLKIQSKEIAERLFCSEETFTLQKLWTQVVNG